MTSWSPAVCLAVLIALAGCGGDTTPPKVPPKPTATATATAKAEVKPEPPPKEKYDVDLLEERNSASPKKMPVVSFDAPGFDQVLPTQRAEDYKVRFKVGYFGSMPEGSYLQILLDNVPFRPITDPKEKVKLTDLNGGQPLTPGEHFLAAFMVRKNHESIKGPRSISVRRFYVDKKADSKFNHRSTPALVLNRPSGNYDSGTQFILIDFVAVNAEIGSGPKHNVVNISLTGPGIKDKLEHNLQQWGPMLVVRAHDGEYELTAQLLDQKLQKLDVPQNPVVRKFTVGKK